MNMGVGRARVGQWYLRWDQGIIFRVIGYDERTGLIHVQTLHGQAIEISDETWTVLPLGFADSASASRFAEPELKRHAFTRAHDAGNLFGPWSAAALNFERHRDGSKGTCVGDRRHLRAALCSRDARHTTRAVV